MLHLPTVDGRLSCSIKRRPLGALALRQLQQQKAHKHRYRPREPERREKAQAVEATKSDIGWGSQIRSYVLDQSRIKDLRTGVETRNTQPVLDGDLDPFIVASLKSGL